MKTSQKIGIFTLAVFLAASSDAFARGGGRGGGKGGFGGFGKPAEGTSFFKSPPPAAPTPKPPPAPAPVAQKAPPPPVSPVPTPKPQEKPQGFFKKDDQQNAVASYDKKAIEAQKHAGSMKAYQDAQDRKIATAKAAQIRKEESKPQVVTNQNVPSSSGNVYDISAIRAARERRVAELSRRMAENGYRERELRARNVYGSYYGQSQQTPVYYGGGYDDSYSNPYFWQWLANRISQAERERFIYNHRSEIDPRRLEQMNEAFPGLSARLDQMKSEGVQVNSTYVPPGLAGNEDLMYGDDVAIEAKKNASSVSLLGWVFLFMSLLVIACSIVYALNRTYRVKEYHV